MISCETSDIELIWNNTARSSLSPISADFTYGAGNYDFLTCRFNSDTAQKMEDNGEILNDTSAVQVKLNGNLVRTMYYDPANLRTGKDVRDSDYSGYLELHDLHEFFTTGEIDIDLSNTPVKNVYRQVYNYRQGEPDPFANKAPIFTFDGKELAEEKDSVYLSQKFTDPSDPDTSKILESADIDNKTPLQAIKSLNNKLEISTRISPSGEFVVGGYIGTNDWVIDESGSNSDYLLESASISQAYQDDLKRVNILGPIELPDSGQDLEGRLQGLAGAASPVGDPDSSGYQLRAFVEDPDLEQGKIKTINLDSTKPDEIAKAGVRAFQKIDAKKQEGTVTVDVSVSNQKQAPRIADSVYIPEPKTCGLLEEPAYRADVYTISSVRHQLQSNWKMDLTLKGIPRDIDDLEFRIGYVDNATGETYTFEDIQGYQPDPQAISWGGSITEEEINE